MRSNIIIFSFLGALFSVAIVYLGEYKFCSAGNDFVCVQIFDDFGMTMFPILPLFLFSLITYFLPERFFITWLKFARVWIPLSMLGILLAPEYSNEFMFAITKGSVAFTMSALFCVISSAILLFKLFQDEKTK